MLWRIGMFIMLGTLYYARSSAIAIHVVYAPYVSMFVFTLCAVRVPRLDRRNICHNTINSTIRLITSVRMRVRIKLSAPEPFD